MIIKLSGQLPSGKNAVQVTRTGHRYPKPQFVAWRAKALAQLAAQNIGKEALNAPLHATISYIPGDLRRRDAPGIIDALWHLLEHAGIVTDDKLIQSIDYKQYDLDRLNPRCTIVLTPR